MDVWRAVRNQGRRNPPGRRQDLAISLPPLDEQKRIAGILDAADALRAKRREALAQLDTLLQSTFLDMFGDPVTNPLGWDVMKFETVGTSRLGKMLDNGKQAGDCQSPYLANFNVQWGRFELNELRQMDFDEADREEFAKRRRFTDLAKVAKSAGQQSGARNWRASIFRRLFTASGLLPRDEPSQSTSCITCGFMAQNGRISRDFTNTATIAHLTGIKLKSLPTPLPPFDLQHRFAAIAESVEQQKTRQRAHLAELDTLFASLQSRAFRGDL